MALAPGRPRKWERAALILFFSALLLVRSVAKLYDNRGFAAALDALQLLPAWALAPFGLLIALTELLSAIGLLAGGRRRRWGAMGTVAVCGFFVAAGLSALIRNISVENIGTFGIFAPDRVTWAHVARDSALLCLAVVLRRLQNRRATDHRAAVAPVRWAARR